ncbi:hypothetical protein [Mesorhizobium sp. YM1C-6-2]|uniref:hypothetical protein n=1 Tax=Mesorhizobium sp. YM1C-6-2 TaxID=1827501 RepID=UPI000EF1DF71|nr:hypothetical protein [Mesorhizobium sp. YM1C-6-2]RLP28382.1 hypothetical protein D8676_04390 [Mesorhizobium sp. YM1C-6-2]
MTADYSKLARLIVGAASQTQNCEEFRRLIATLLAGSLVMMHKRYDRSPTASVDWVELAMQDAFEMFTDLEGLL